MTETTTPHTRLLRLGLAQAESKEYWAQSHRTLQGEEKLRVAFEERWFGSRSMTRVKYLLSNFAYRFDAFPEALQTLHRWAPEAERRVICHWHLQLTDPLYRAFTAQHLVERFKHPEPTLDRNAVVRWLEQHTARRWAGVTLERMTASLLNVLSEANFITGLAVIRPLTVPRVSDQALSYLLYLLRDLQFEGTLSHNPYLASLQLTLKPRLPGIQFHRQGDVSEINWEYPNLAEWGRHLG